MYAKDSVYLCEKMSGKDSVETVVRSLPFNGEEKSFAAWRDKFEAVACAKSYLSALESDADLPFTSSEMLDPTDEDDIVRIKARQANDNAMAALTLALTDTAIGRLFIGRAKSTEYPRGKAHRVWTLLKEHYKPTDAGR